MEWRKAYFLFAMALLLILGTAQMINPATISTFNNSVGVQEQPVAQSYLPLVLFPVIVVYNLLVTVLIKKLGRPGLLVIFMCCVYAAIYTVLAIKSFAGDHVDSSLGWVLFYTTNTKAVTFPVMFWSVMNDISDSQSLKVAMPALITAGQVGGFAFSLFAANATRVGGTPTLLITQAVGLVLIAVMVGIGCRKAASVPRVDRAAEFSQALDMKPGNSQEVAQQQVAGPAPSFCTSLAVGVKVIGMEIWKIFEGLYIICSRPYMAGIFCIACAHLVPRVVLDYQGTALVNERWPRTVDGHAVHENKDKQTEFFAWCNLANTIGTLLLSNLGFRKLVDRGGLVLTLLACPVAMLTSVLVVCVYRDFWTVQVVLVVVNTIQYALSGPSREMLYIQTSKDVKYKAKSWSDMYGNFIQKTIGAELNLHVNREMASCTPHCFKPVFTGVYTIVWCSVWAIIATLLGKMHARLVKNNKIIS
jgi:ATP/ADP translocase